MRLIGLFGYSRHPFRCPTQRVVSWESSILFARRGSRLQERFFQENGIDKLFELANAVAQAGYLGQAMVKFAGIAVEARNEILARALKSDSDKEHDLARGMIWTWQASAGRTWAEGLANEALRNGWGERAILTILLALPSTGWLWAIAKRAGPMIEGEYWKKVPVLWVKDDKSHASYAVDMLIAAGRARDSVHLMGFHLHGGQRFASALLVRALMEAGGNWSMVKCTVMTARCSSTTRSKSSSSLTRQPMSPLKRWFSWNGFSFHYLSTPNVMPM